MDTQNYRTAGWVAIAAVVAFIGEIVASFMGEIPAYANATLPTTVAIFMVLHIALASFTLFRFRMLLNERCDFHGVDRLVPLLIAGGILLGIALIFSRQFASAGVQMAVQIGIGVPLGIGTMVFGQRLLSVNDALGGYKKPLAYGHIAAPICFFTIVLAPIGLFLSLAMQIMLALVFFNDEVEPEFV